MTTIATTSPGAVAGVAVPDDWLAGRGPSTQRPLRAMPAGRRSPSACATESAASRTVPET